MKLATLKRGGRDGTLVVVSRDLRYCKPVPNIATTMQQVMDSWDEKAAALVSEYDKLNAGQLTGAILFDPAECHSPLPRAYQWVDGSGYINHVELVRKARGADLPPELYTDPLMYQGGSDSFVGPQDPILVADETWGIDFEAEVAYLIDDVPMGASSEQCEQAVRLIMLVNDVSLRNLIPRELAKGFGFVQSKPACAFSPIAVTPSELGAAWQNSKVVLPLQVHYNDKLFGRPNAGQDVTFGIGQLISHVAKTRDLVAGSIVGTGTVSNRQNGQYGSSIENGGVGYCCLAELRMYEILEQGKPQTPFMKFGDSIRIEMFDENGVNIFGSISQRVKRIGEV